MEDSESQAEDPQSQVEPPELHVELPPQPPAPVAPEPPAPSPTPTDNSLVTLESLSKILTMVVVVLYACGFLITCITYSSYGFLDMNPLRPRPVLAGAWFVSFCGLSFALLKGCAKLQQEIKQSPASWLLYARAALSYVIGCAALTTCTRFFFDIPSGTPPIFSWTFYAVAAVLFALCVFAELGHIPAQVASFPTSGGLLLLSVIIFRQTFHQHIFADGALFLWFSIGSLLTVFVLGMFSSDRVDSWPLGVFVILAGLLVFARYYYPHAKPSWGGGGLLPVVIYTGKDAAIPGQKISAMLIEDSDAGLYFLLRGDSRATFLPKSAIASIYFAEDGPALKPVPKTDPH